MYRLTSHVRLNYPRLTLILILCFGLIVSQSSSAKVVTIGLDLSGSNPLMISEDFSKKAANDVLPHIKDLKDGDQVRLMSFGARNSVQNLRDFTVTISRKNKASKIAQELARAIRSIPRGMLEKQQATNIITWLEYTPNFRCEDNSQILLITDGVEDSDVFSAKKLLSGEALPAPKRTLEGCSVYFYGLGVGLSGIQLGYLHKAWAHYINQANGSFFAEPY